MIKFLSQNLMNCVLKLNLIEKEDENLYAYGAELAISYILNLIAIIIIGAVMDMIFYTIAFLIIFIPLKSYSGGYHAPNYLICFIMSCITVVAVLYITKYGYGYVPNNILILIMAFMGMMIYILGPIEDKNKPLTESEYTHFKYKIKIILVAEFIIAFASSIIGFDKMVFIFFCNFIVTLGVSSAGLLKNTFANV